MRRVIAAIAILLIGWTATAMSAEQVPAAPAAAVTELGRHGASATGQPITLPPAPLEVVFSRAVLPVGGVLPMHKHPWPRYALVESGQIRVRYEAAGIERLFGAGDVLIEAVDAWHEGVAVGAEPVRILVIDHVPPGRTNVVRR